eukprot:352678-Chlamydomonas_euryale.AAC.3
MHDPQKRAACAPHTDACAPAVQRCMCHVHVHVPPPFPTRCPTCSGALRGAPADSELALTPCRALLCCVNPQAAGDDYSYIMAESLADRLAEAFAELLHERVRKEWWGYAPDEKLSTDDLLKVKYQGIRPAPGYPSQPDHTEKSTMWSLLQPDVAASITLTDSLAMSPAASVSGLYFGGKCSNYFAVGKITKEQIDDYAARKDMPIDEAQRWLRTCLNYEP